MTGRFSKMWASVGDRNKRYFKPRKGFVVVPKWASAGAADIVWLTLASVASYTRTSLQRSVIPRLSPRVVRSRHGLASNWSDRVDDTPEFGFLTVPLPSEQRVLEYKIQRTQDRARPRASTARLRVLRSSGSTRERALWRSSSNSELSRLPLAIASGLTSVGASPRADKLAEAAMAAAAAKRDERLGKELDEQVYERASDVRGRAGLKG